ncbi:MAG: class II glutamine amidotransferase [Candidatus Omnitrophica bacterium]|nr:class II glutamine amidotransferase [Candidatus Omnitrophota bacterium]
MCRLFGIVANKKVDIKFSMLEASRSFKLQGKKNPDGWGVGWYEEGKVKIVKYGENAFYSNRFDELVKQLKAEIIIAHVRDASCGNTSDENAHPFGYNNWIFAHNGTINKKRIENLLKEPYSQNFTSEPIDSEIYFRYIIQCIEEKKDVIKGIEEGVKEVIKEGCCGANFLLSDGEKLYAFKYGRDLFYLKRDKLTGLSFKSKETNLNALIKSKMASSEKAILVATERLTDENWQILNDGDLLIIDKLLQINIKKLNLYL